MKGMLTVAGNLFSALTVVTLILGIGFRASAQSTSKPYPKMAPTAQYQMPRTTEIAMARSAAPESISRDAKVLVLGPKTYETAADGTNGFVCLVQRSWAAGVNDPEFWNPRLRAPICLNAAATRTYLPHIVKKAEWALAGLSKEQIARKIETAVESKEWPPLASGAMCYMMSKDGYLNDRDGHWHPHLMFFVPQVAPDNWGANLQASPVIGVEDKTERLTIFMLPVGKWSDGTVAPAM
jgi:hypothetical protein